MDHVLLDTCLIGFIKASIAALVGMLMVFLSAGCNSTGDDNADRPTGSAAVSVSTLNPGDVAGATITITASDISTPITAALSSSNGWQATIGGIPAGTMRTFALSATDATGLERYDGSATNVTIAAGQTVSVNILAEQTSPSAAFADSVPVIDLAQTSSNTVAPGTVVSLTVTAHDPDQGDSLSYAWTASTGTFASATAQSTTWTAPTTLGTYPITISVRDSKQEATTATIQVTVAAATQVPIPRFAVWLLAGLLATVGGLLSCRQRKLAFARR